MQAQREMESAKANRERAERYLREIEEAMGGAPAVAAGDPNLGIAKSMERVSIACAPPGSRVRVHIDRFTEFTLVIELPQPTNLFTMASISHCILAYRAAYVHRLQIVQGGSIVAELDRQAIESINDWWNPPADEVQQLLSMSRGGTNMAREKLRVDSPRQETEEQRRNLTPEGRRLTTAEQRFQAMMDAGHADFRSALDRLQEATEFSAARPSVDLETRRAGLRQAVELARTARAALEDPAAHYGQALREAGVDEVYSRGAVRTVAARYDPLRTVTAEALRRLGLASTAGSMLLEVLGQHAGQWSFDVARRAFRFHSAEANRAIGAALDVFEAENQALASAIARRNQAMR